MAKKSHESVKMLLGRFLKHRMKSLAGKREKWAFGPLVQRVSVDFSSGMHAYFVVSGGSRSPILAQARSYDAYAASTLLVYVCTTRLTIENGMIWHLRVATSSLRSSSVM